MGDANPERADPAERLAAVAALVAPLAAIAIVAVAAAANWQGIVITFIGLLLIVVAGWYVVSRRGVSRSVGVVIGLTGTGLLIAGFIVADLSLLTWVLVAVLALLSVVAARGTITTPQTIGAGSSAPSAFATVTTSDSARLSWSTGTNTNDTLNFSTSSGVTVMQDFRRCGSALQKWSR